MADRSQEGTPRSLPRGHLSPVPWALSCREKTLQDASLTYQQFKNCRDNLSSWLEHLPHSQVWPSDGPSQITYKLQAQKVGLGLGPWSLKPPPPPGPQLPVHMLPPSGQRSKAHQGLEAETEALALPQLPPAAPHTLSPSLAKGSVGNEPGVEGAAHSLLGKAGAPQVKVLWEPPGGHSWGVWTISAQGASS